MAHLHIGFSGFFTITRRHPETLEVLGQVGPFKNLIVNSGLDAIAQRPPISGCRVGTGTTEPAVTDTSLAIPRASTTSVLNTNTSFSNSSPYYTAYSRTFRFAAGAASGNITEMSIHVDTGEMWSRSLVKDSSGNPVAITVLANEVLDVTYECRMYLMEVDSTGSATLLGQSYSYILRSANLGTRNWSRFLSSGVDAGAAGYYLQISSGKLIGPITGQPPGSFPVLSSGSIVGGYTPGTYYKDMTLNFALGVGNVSGGIGAMLLSSLDGEKPPDYQIQFTPPFPKDNTMTFGLTIRLSWGRYAP